MLETRVERLEGDLKEVKASLKAIELAVAEIKHLPRSADYAGIRSDAAELKGRLSQSPTVLQLVATIVTTWSAGAAIVFTLLRYAKP